MNPFDEKPSQPPHDQPVPDQSREASREESLDELSARIVIHPAEPSSAPLSGDRLAGGFPPSAPPPPAAESFLPPDLRISWSWLHFLFFGLFLFGSIVAIQIAIVVTAVLLALADRLSGRRDHARD